MMATYTIETNTTTLKFYSKALSLKKCLQINRLNNNKKMWKGYSLVSISFDIQGLQSIHIRHKTTITHGDLFSIKKV